MAEQVRLRKLVKEDTAVTWHWRNQVAVKDHFSGHPYEVSQEQEEDWFEKNVRFNDTQTVFAVELLKDNRLVGMTFLKNINKIHRQAEFAILIDQEQAGKGFGKEACWKTVLFAFTELKLHRLFLKVRSDNPAAIRIYESCGFRKEGELRDDVYKNGAFRNQLIMGILEAEFSGH